MPNQGALTVRNTGTSLTVRLSLAVGLLLACALCFAAEHTGSVQVEDCSTLIPPIKQGYGASGPFQVMHQEVANPAWRRKPVTVFYPAGLAGRLPVIFFSHGFGQTDWETGYPRLIEHIVSRGYLLVYAPYPNIGGHERRYEILREGFAAAVNAVSARMDLERVGFAGHSYGGGATPAMAYWGLVQRGWGSKSAFMLIMAPWYVLGVSEAMLQRFPAHTQVLLQVYDRDAVNDQRMALFLFDQLKLEHKWYMVLRSESAAGCEYIADHVLPAHGISNVLKYYGIYRTFDALADYSFNGAQEGAALLPVEDKSSQAFFMGTWPNGSPYLPGLLFGERPSADHPQQFYRFAWDNRNNPWRSYTWK